MGDAVFLTTDGPHSPGYTAKVADAVDLGMRVLCYATRAGEDGLTHPSDAYALLGALCTATGRGPQLFAQLAAFLDRAKASGRLCDSSGGDPAERTALAAARLAEAGAGMEMVTRALEAAQNATSGLYFEDGAKGESDG